MNRFTYLVAAIAERKLAFFTIFFVTIFVTYAFLYIIDFYPEPVSEESVTEIEEEVSAADTTQTVTGVTSPEPIETVESVASLPQSITIEKLDRTVPVNNPQSREIADLDQSLLSGVVRHPDSATFREDGNIFILGHSSYLPNVLNRNFQAFNGVQNLTWGDMIYLDSADTRYTYRVNKVYEAKASEVVVPFTPGEARLTLATCNSFASKDDRYIVEAVLLETETLDT